MQGGVIVGVGVQWCTELCHKVHCFVEECRGAWRSVVLCGLALWRRSDSHHLKVSHGVTTTSSQEGYWMILDDIVTGSGVQQCTKVCN